jgi:hypothetical protein
MATSTPLGRPKKPATTEPSLDAVKAFVAAASTPQASEPPKITTPSKEAAVLEVSEEVQAALNKQAEGPKLPEPDIPLEAVALPEFATQDKMRSDALAGDVLNVLVSDNEKDIYCKAVLFDAPVVWDIPVLGGKASVLVRSLKITHEDAILRWLDQLEKQGTVTTQSLWLTYYKRASTLLRVLKMTVDGRDVLVFNHATVDSLLDTSGTTKKALDQLTTVFDKVFENLTPARYAVLMEAVTVHERKMNKCNRSAASGNFWLPAGTD